MKEKIEIRNENGVHYAYFRGVKLPCLIESTVNQGVDILSTNATLKFEVVLKEKKETTFTISANDLKGLLTNVSKRKGGSF